MINSNQAHFGVSSMPAENYKAYKSFVSSEIASVKERMNCQPIFFIGAGLSKRFFGAPNWIELLSMLKAGCPRIDVDVQYYIQEGKTLEEIGEIFVDKYREWAWREGRASFPDELFVPGVPRDAYIKYYIAKIIENITPKGVEDIKDDKTQRELKLLIASHPHAIITTNYDTFLESIFPDFNTVIGQNILCFDQFWIGEIYKIHGCVKEPNTLVFHKTDYDKFLAKKKYLSAKLLTYLIEHPVFFIGYKAEDKNIKAILSDLNEILSDNGDSISNNMFFLRYFENIDENSTPPMEDILPLEGDRRMRIKVVHYSELDWVLQSLSTDEPLERVDVRLLRALMARSLQLVRTDVPKRKVEVDYSAFKSAIEGDGFLNILGVTEVDPSNFANTFPYLLAEVAKKLGYKHWFYANKLILKIRKDTQVDIKASDNKYHISIKTGTNSVNHHYSESGIELLKKVQAGQSYSLDF